MAFILILSEIAKEREIVQELLKIPGVVEARLLFGEYDALARVEVADIAELDKVVTAIRNVRGVVKTITLISS
ncbi:MAG: Lrp/AsnC ligand binding domain-containing protein [Candidatus Nezhaarchaeota archaeon]|nr:Lrp/AsnC ligand binding domain-containing protein [Candidatus Nezhaarchaeota archaeon]